MPKGKSDYEKDYRSKLKEVNILFQENKQVQKELGLLLKKESIETKKTIVSYPEGANQEEIDRITKNNENRVRKAKEELQRIVPKIKPLQEKVNSYLSDLNTLMKKTIMSWVLSRYPRDNPQGDMDNIENMIKSRLKILNSEKKNSSGVKIAGITRGIQLEEEKLATLNSNMEYVIASYGFYRFKEEFTEIIFDICQGTIMGGNQSIISETISSLMDSIRTPKITQEKILQQILLTIRNSVNTPCDTLSEERQTNLIKQLDKVRLSEKIKNDMASNNGIARIFFETGSPVQLVIQESQRNSRSDINSGLSQLYANVIAYSYAREQIPIQMESKYKPILERDYDKIFTSHINSFINGPGIEDCSGKNVTLYDSFPGSRDAVIINSIKDGYKALNQCEKACGKPNKELPEAYIPQCYMDTPSVNSSVPGAPLIPGAPPIPAPPSIPGAPPL